MSGLFKVTIFTGLLTILKIAIGFIIAKVVAVYTGPAGLAILGQTQGMLSSFSGLINAPVGNGIVRYTAENKEKGFESCAQWWTASLQWILIISSIIIPLGLFFSSDITDWLYKNTEYEWVVILSIILLPFFSIGTLLNSVLNGLQNYKLYVTLGMFSVVISGAAMVGLVLLYGLNGVLIAAVFQAFIISLVMIFGTVRQPWLKINYWLKNTNATARRDIAKYVLMALTTALTAPVSLIIVRNIIIENAGWDSAGHWQAVWKISEVYIGVITIALSTYFLPKLATLNSAEQIVNEISRNVRIVFPLMIFLSFIVYFFRHSIISLLFTNEFNGAENLFLYQLIGDIFKILSWMYAFPMIARGTLKWFVPTEVFFTISFIIIADLLVSYIGVCGANVAYLLNYIFYFLFVFFNVRRFST